jgi:hypothetical protein
MTAHCQKKELNMFCRLVLIIVTALFISSPTWAGFPVTTAQLGTNGEVPGHNNSADAGLPGIAGEPSGTVTVRNGGNGGQGGTGGDGGTGGRGGNGTWHINANITFADSQYLPILYLGGSNGQSGPTGDIGPAGEAGGDGGFANWSFFTPGQDGDGPGGGQGSLYVGTTGGDGEYDSGGGGGGSCGPDGIIQVMSSGGIGHGGAANSGPPAITGEDGAWQIIQTNSDLLITNSLYVGGNGGNGGQGGSGGIGGGGGGGAGGGSTWPAGVGGAGGVGGIGGIGGNGGNPGDGWLNIQSNGSFTNEGEVSCHINGYIQVSGIFQNSSNGIIRNYGHLVIAGTGNLSNFGTIESFGDNFTNDGTITNYGNITGDLNSSGYYEGIESFTGNFQNSGTVSPGIGNQPGFTSISHLDNSGGQILIHLGGLTSEPQTYDQLRVSDSFYNESTTLKLEFVNEFSEADMIHGDYFDIILYQELFPPQFDEIDDSLASLLDGHWVVAFNQSVGDDWYSVRLWYMQDQTAVGDSNLPTSFSIDGVFPNPFNPQTTIIYALPRASMVEFRIFDIAGQQVWCSDTGSVIPPGRYELVWNGTDASGRNLSSGTYILRMTAGDFGDVRKIVLVR